jgi:hypothetical protein
MGAVILVLSSFPAFAQSPAPPPAPLDSNTTVPPHPDRFAAVPDVIGDPAARAAELDRWIRDFEGWREWSAEWRGRPEPGLFTGYRPRRDMPEPPVWLAARCATTVDDAELMTRACRLLAEWRDGDVAAETVREARADATERREEASKTRFWEHIHVDLFWPALQWQAGIYGVAGMHAATSIRGRWQVFVAPGAMLLNLPTRNGHRAWKVAANYGIGYRLIDFTFPGGRPAVLHVNLAKTWILSSTADLAVGRTVDVIGLSVTFRRTP